jgi:outer membrane protein assembly factor BamB
MSHYKSVPESPGDPNVGRVRINNNGRIIAVMRAGVVIGVVAALCVACASPSQAPPVAPTPQPPIPTSVVQGATAVAAPKPSATAQPSAPPAASAAVAPDADWLTYQHDIGRSGQSFGIYNPAGMQQVWKSPQLDGAVYAQILVSGNRAFAVTQNNTAYALDADTGETLWSAHLGDPVPRAALPCGNVDPTGILSTPAIDASSQTLYLVDYLRQPPHHELVALDLATGAVRYHNAIDPPDANPLTLQQRAALAVNNDNVYVPFGGLFGDCGDYHGWVVTAGASDGHQRATYQVPTHRQGAIWGAPAMDIAGDVFVATGNGDSTSTFDQSNSVVRLSSDLKLLDFFAPSNWADLSRRDADLGSTGPIVLDGGQVLQVGKSGIGYLLNATGLGQIGGEMYQAPVCSDGAFGGGAHTGTVAYVACHDGLVAVQVQPTSFLVVWRGPQFSAGAPLITDDAVWTLDDATTSLYAMSRQDGSVLYREPAGQATNPPHFLAPSAAGGRIYHSVGNGVMAFTSASR